jgi:PPE-repeat protein
MESSTSHKRMGLHGLLQEQFYFSTTTTNTITITTTAITTNTTTSSTVFITIHYFNIITNDDHFCGLVVGVPGYRSRGLGSIPGTTRFSEKYWVWNGVHSAS